MRILNIRIIFKLMLLLFRVKLKMLHRDMISMHYWINIKYKTIRDYNYFLLLGVIVSYNIKRKRNIYRS